MRWDVHYADAALQDLQNIYDYISDVLLEPGIAEKQTDRIMSAAESLEHMPYRYRLCEYKLWHSKGLRVLPVDNYLIFYLPDESRGVVDIYRIIYGSRDIGNHLGFAQK